MFSVFVFCALGWSVAQAKLELMFDDAECTNFNKEYIQECEFEVIDDSEYETALRTHIKIIKELPGKFMTLANINGMEMGEYTNDMGIHVKTDVCELTKDPTSIIAPIIKAINVAPDNCPPKPGSYGNDAFVINEQDGLPDSFPAGKYLLNITLTDENLTFACVHIYLIVV